MGSEKTSALAEKILGAIHDIPDTRIKKLVSAWDSGTRVTKYNLEEIVGISGQKADRLVSLVADPSLDHETLKAMFVTGLAAKSKASHDANEVEIVWTGPGRISAGARSTRPVIEEMLRSARRGEKVTIVGYRITHNAKSIIGELNSCLNGGVEIDLIVDNSRSNKDELRKCFAEKRLARPSIYTRKDGESEFYKVHAKVIMVQDRQMLVSSANLTELGTEVNFEIGLLVSGPAVRDMAALIKRMVEERYFVEDG